MKKVSVVIPVFNCLDYTIKCIECLLKMKSSIDQLIIMDNGSTDNTVTFLEKLEKKYKGWVITKSFKENRGFVYAVNSGIDISSPENDIIILNNDVEIHDTKMISKLQEKAYADDKIVAVHPRQLSTDLKFLCGPSFTLPVSKIGYSYGNELDVNQFIEDQEAEVLMFACCYIKREAIIDIGKLDPNIFSYCEDSDWCLRADIKKRKKLYAGSLSVIHHHNITTRENDLDYSDMHKKSVFYFANKHNEYFEREKYRHELNWQGVTGYPTGYSKLSEKFIRALEDNKVKVNYGFIYGITEFEPKSTDRFIQEITSRHMGNGGIQVVAAQGDVFYKNSGDYKIGLSMMDCSKWPDEWVKQSNTLNELWIPTDHGAEIAKKSGIKTKITTIPLGVDPNYFNPDIKPLHEYQYNHYRRGFNLVSVFEWGERKQPELLMEAFYKAFYNDNDACLFIKAINNDSSVNIKKSIFIARNKYPLAKCTINFYTGPDFKGMQVPEYLMGSFYRMHDAFFWTSAGEGFGLPPVEALSCGLPVAITGEYGYLPYQETLNQKPGVVLFDTEKEECTPKIVKCPYYWGAEWSKPKIDDIVDKLRDLKENFETHKEGALKSSKWIRKNLSWDKIVKTKMIPAIEKVVDIT